MKAELRSRMKDRLLRFIAYGNPKGDVWFLGMEEAFPGNKQLWEEEFGIRARRFRLVENLMEAHQKLRRPDAVESAMSRPWQYMARLARACEGKDYCVTK